MPERRLHPQVEAYRRERHAAGVRPLRELSVAEARLANSPRSSRRLRSLSPTCSSACCPAPTARRAFVSMRLKPIVRCPLSCTSSAEAGCWARWLPSIPCAAGSRMRRPARSCRSNTGEPRRIPSPRASRTATPRRAGSQNTAQSSAWIRAVSRSAVRAPAATSRPRSRYSPASVEGPRSRSSCSSIHHSTIERILRRSDRSILSFSGQRMSRGAGPITSPSRRTGTTRSPRLSASTIFAVSLRRVITADLDPLRDQGELYGARLEGAGVSVELVRFEGAVHGFFSRADLFDAGAEAQALAASALRHAFAST